MCMKNMGALVLSASLLGLVMMAGESFAAGFRLPDQDAAALGMAGAFTGQADNPSAAWYNPAAITEREGAGFSAGVMGIYPVMKHENPGGATDVAERKVYLPVELFYTNKMSDQVGWGLAVTSPFGLSTDWAETSSTSAVATFSRIKSFEINPNIAYRVNDDLSIAAGVGYMVLQATMEKMLGPGARFRLDGEGTGWGANAGVLYKATDKLNIGLSYRSRIKVKLDEGTAEATGPVPPFPLSNSAQTEVTLPDLIQLGASYKVSNDFRLNADLDYTLWSTYDRLVVKSDTILALTGTDTSIDEKEWKDSLAVRVGGQYALSGQWKMRAGFVYDQNPVPEAHFDTRTPDSDRYGITIGTGFTRGNITVDTSYMYLRFKERTITESEADGASQVLNGTYKSEAHLLGVNLAYKF